MHPQIKRFFIGVSLFVLAFGGLVAGRFVIGLEFLDHWAFLVLVVLAVVGGVLFLWSHNNALAIIDWWRLKLGPTRLFPDSDEKARALRPCWAKNQLTGQALEASIWAEKRDAWKGNVDGFVLTPLDAMAHNLETLEKALKTREEELSSLEQIRRKYLYTAKHASREFRRYTRMWDLFKHLKMLPVNPSTKAPYDDPDIFRKAAREADIAQRGQETTVASPAPSGGPVSVACSS